MTFKQCRNNCGINIEMRQTDGKWKPYEDNGQIHRCPNWKQFTETAQKIEKEITLKPQESVFKPNNALGKLAELETEFASKLTDVNKRVSRLEQAIQGLVAQVNFMTGKDIAKIDIDEQVVTED